MGMTRDEFSRAVKDAPGTVGRRGQILTLLRDTVAAEHLVGDEKWDRFLEWVSGVMKEINAAREAAQSVLRDPRVVGHDDLMRAKIVLADLDGQRKALEWVMALPRQLKDGAATVRGLLKEDQSAA